MVKISFKQYIRRYSLSTVLLVTSSVMLIVVLLNVGLNSQVRRSDLGVASISNADALVKNYTIHYPVFHKETIDKALRNYAVHHMEEFLQKLAGNSNDPNSHLLVSYTILHYGDRTVSVEFRKEEQLQGRSRLASEQIMTFDLESQAKIELSAVVDNEKVATIVFSRILHDYFKHSESTRVTDTQLTRLKQFSLKDAKDLAFDDEHIIFTLEPGLDSVRRVETIAIRRELLANILKDKFRPSEKSRIDVVQRESASHVIDRMPQHDVVIDASKKMLALTFDDGPGVLTPKILDTLKLYGGYATFFVIGRQVPQHPDVVRREITEGHEIGNHSWSHPNFNRISASQMEQQINDTQDAIHRVAGYTPVLLRPPEGVFNGAVVAYAQSRHLAMQLWNVDTLDWLDRNTQVTYDRIMSGAGDGKVILLHDIHATSVDAVLKAIPELIAQGYQLVTVSQMKQFRQ